jgi:hypothetical protein
MNAELLKSQIIEYSLENVYLAEKFVVPRCADCACEIFTLVINADEGVAARTCTSCSSEQGIGDSDDFFDDIEEVVEVKCSCGSSDFEIMAAVALYPNTEDVRWFYLGLECSKCHDSGVYADWKNEYMRFQKLLNRV